MPAAPRDFRDEELLADVIARLIGDVRHVAVGNASPIPATAALLARARGNGRPYVSLLGSPRHSFWSEGGRELFDCAGQGRIDVFFLSGGQIDGQANINLIGTGEWPGRAARFPGSFGSAFMYMMTPRTILFREEHSPRVLVSKVDIVSAPGVSPPGVFRRGTAQALVTGRCVFRFHPDRARFSLMSVHPGETVESVRAETGFAFDVPASVPATQEATEQELALLRGPVRDAMLEPYPDFCARVFDRKAAAA
jgi:glutaconate CoA-transferase subunit B